MQLNFPPLAAEDIEVRVDRCNSQVLNLLLYKNARVDMRMLDEAVGAMNWTRQHCLAGGVNYCTVSIYDSDRKEWIGKQDCGSIGTFEPDKAASSDAFKRACFNWGIGRELYTAPEIAIWWNRDNMQLCNVRQNDKGKWVCYDHFSVSQIIIENKVIKALSIRNDDTGKYVFRIDTRNTEHEMKEVA